LVWQNICLAKRNWGIVKAISKVDRLNENKIIEVALFDFFITVFFVADYL
jgi:hypothetical protein